MTSRQNSEAIRREDLLWMLRRADIVAFRRQMNRCFLCCMSPVNEAGLCHCCSAILDGEELKVVESWLSGAGPQ